MVTAMTRTRVAAVDLGSVRAMPNQLNMTRKARFRLQLFEIALDQDWKCYWCGWPIDELTATRDHLVLKSKGGSNRRANIVAACFPCNKKRGSAAAPPPGYLAARRRNLPRSNDVIWPSSKQVRQVNGGEQDDKPLAQPTDVGSS
jgi:5-methylcytosine-specific restriction endonuclease McrA